MSDDKTNLDSMKLDVKDSYIDSMDSAEPDIELIARINAGQKIGTPNVSMPQEEKPNFTPPTLKSKDK